MKQLKSKSNGNVNLLIDVTVPVPMLKETMLKIYSETEETSVGILAEYMCVKHPEYLICIKRRMLNEVERNEAREKCCQLTAVHA